MAIYFMAIVTSIALICFFIAYNIADIPEDNDFLYYYETIFWGGGHILQYSYCMAMMVAWIWMANLCKIKHIIK